MRMGRQPRVIELGTKDPERRPLPKRLATRLIVLITLSLLLTLGLAGGAAASELFSKTQITVNAYGDAAPQVAGDRVVWQASVGVGNDIFVWMWGDPTPTRVTDDAVDDLDPQISGDRIVWESLGDILTWKWGDVAPTELSDNILTDEHPQISLDRVVWQGDSTDGLEIFTRKIGDATPTQITAANLDENQYPQVSGDRVVWQGKVEGDAGGDFEIFTWTPTGGMIRLTNNAVDDWFPQVAGDRVVWESEQGYWQVCTWKVGDAAASQLTLSSYDNRHPQVSGNRVVWEANTGGDWEILTWTPSGGMAQISNNTYYDGSPQIAGDRVVWFGGGSTSKYEANTWTPTAGRTRLTTDSTQDYQPVVSGNRVVWYAAGGSDSGADTEIFTGRPLSYYENTDPNLSYGGSWYTVTSSSASGGNFRYANSTGSAVTIKFNGAGLALFAKKGPAYGKAKVTVDGGAPVYADFYSPSTLYQQNVYGTGALLPGEHTIVIEWSGTKNTASSGYIISIDSMYVDGTLVAAPAPPGSPVVIQETDDRLVYAGTWYNAPASAASGGAYRYANSGGSSVTVTFKGTGLAMFAKKSPAYGKAKVTLDALAPVYVDLYSPGTLYQQNVYGTGTLADVNHTLIIEWAGQKNAASSGYLIDLDGFIVAGDLIQGPGLVRYEQSDSHFAYAGDWYTAATSAALGGSYAYANSPGAQATVTFHGTGLALFVKKGPVYGQIKVTLDGGTPVNVELYNAGNLYQQNVYGTGTLADGDHTVIFEWAGIKHEASAGYLISIDAVYVMNTL